MPCAGTGRTAPRCGRHITSPPGLPLTARLPRPQRVPMLRRRHAPRPVRPVPGPRGGARTEPRQRGRDRARTEADGDRREAAPRLPATRSSAPSMASGCCGCSRA